MRTSNELDELKLIKENFAFACRNGALEFATSIIESLEKELKDESVEGESTNEIAFKETKQNDLAKMKTVFHDITLPEKCRSAYLLNVNSETRTSNNQDGNENLMSLIQGFNSLPEEDKKGPNINIDKSEAMLVKELMNQLIDKFSKE